MLTLRRLSLVVAIALFATASLWAQSTTGTVQGTVKDNQDAVVPGATVTLRNTQTNATRTLVTDGSGNYRFLNLPVGVYALAVELPGFSKYSRDGITLSLNQDAVIDVKIQPATISESIEVTADAPLLNTTTPEVGVRFDQKRVSELPLAGASFRDVFAVALSAPGVSQLGSGQQGFASGTNFSSNGMRVRSNNFMIDGQDSNDPSVTGRQQPINNTDIIQEVRLITNQFAAEFGRAAGSVVNVVTKNGTNAFHGSGFGFFNDESLNARSNLDKAALRPSAPFREERQLGGTVGGPVVRNRTFFFGSYQRWTDRALGSGFTLNGAPTEAGRAVLQSAVGTRPQIQALLQFLPAAQTPLPQSASFTANGQSFTVPLGSLTGSSSIKFDNNQVAGRVDHQFGNNHTLTGRYLLDDTPENSGTGQVTPPGLTTVNPANRHSLNIWLNSVLSPNMSNEFRGAWAHLGTVTGSVDPSSESIPSIEISELGLTGFNAAANRTAIGLAVNLPQFRYNDTYQFQNNLTYIRGKHLIKGGFDVRYQYVKSFFFPTIRGRLSYPTLQRYVDDNAEVANINKPLPGGEEVNYYRWWDQYYYVQDEWKAGASLTLNFGLRYELPGNNIQSLIELQERILAANGNNDVYRLKPVPSTDKNNFQPRIGFNWAPVTETGGMVGMLTGGDKFVLRGGYARTNDYAFLNIALNIVSSFPYVAAINRSNVSNAFVLLQSTPAGVPPGDNPNLLTRTVVGEDFRSPMADQFSLEVQRQLVRQPRVPRRLRRDVWQGSLPDARRQPAPAVLRQSVHDGPAPRSDRRRHPAARERSRVLVPLAADGSRQTVQRRSERRRPLHVEQVSGHRVGSLQPVERRGRGRAGFVRHRQRQGSVVLRSPASPHGQLRVGAALDARPGWRHGQDPRRLAGQLVLHAPERGAVYGAQRRGPDRRARRDRRAGRQRHPAEPQHRPRSLQDDRVGDPRGRRPEPVPSDLRDAEPRRAPESGWATSAAIRSAPTASAPWTSGSRRTRASSTARTSSSASRCSTPRTRATSESPRGA